MRALFLFIALLASTPATFSQSPASPQPCGTPAYKSPWLKNYQKNPTAYKGLTDSLLHIPMTIQSVGNDAGIGYFPVSNILDALCILNEDLAPANIRFFISDSIRFIPNSNFNQHDSVLDGGYFMLQYNIENTVNTYFVTDPAGNCGYNLPWAGIAMNKGCSGIRSHTWAHEVGHNLSLPHPFFGWEGGVNWDNTVPHNLSNPAPRTVTANYTSFKDSLITDTLIIDTVLVELVDRSNCGEAADGFCDTEPDYLSSRWNCNTNGVSPTVQTDPDGNKFNSDGTLIMSYSDDNCANRFSEDQMAAMRANLLDEKPFLISTMPPREEIDPDFAFLPLSPMRNETVNSFDVLFEWDPVKGADRYLFQISRLPSFAVTQVDLMLITNQTLINDLVPGATYYWRIRPFNNYSVCAGFSESISFKTTEIITSTQIKTRKNALSIQPNLIQSGQEIKVDWKGMKLKAPFWFEIRDVNGIRVARYSFEQNTGHDLVIQTPSLSPGIYFFGISHPEGRWFEKVMVE